MIKAFLTFLFSAFIACSCLPEPAEQNLTQSFKGGYGQIEIGGKYVGLEFHHSRSLPSRISFYYPVANSVDLSEGYWTRDQSMPISMTINTTNGIDTLGLAPYPYDYTPYHVNFKGNQEKYSLKVSYDVCEDLPLFVLRLSLENNFRGAEKVTLTTEMNPLLRTSHTYARLVPERVEYDDGKSVVAAMFPLNEADSVCVFIINVGAMARINKEEAKNHRLRYTYNMDLNRGDDQEIIQLIGMCPMKEFDSIIGKSMASWSQSMFEYEKRVMDYTFTQSFFDVKDSALQKTMHWSKAVIASNTHYINGHYLPMPCPAEYNFFFTHDLFLSSLGVVYYDTDYVKEGLLFLQSLSKPDHVLPHAYYWKDGRYVTEYCTSDNWNHLWFIIVSSTYLKHSNDQYTIKSIFPMLKKSLMMALGNKQADDLMYASRPDWWDIGQVYGARSYTTILMYKALLDYIYIASILGEDENQLLDYLNLAERMRQNLVSKLWDDNEDYLFNMLEAGILDRHYYAGSILATHHNLLDEEKSKRLLQTVNRKLLDPNIGVRTVMPADFHQLIDVYRFQGMEAGEPYVYLNGGVWPHLNVWYALGLLYTNQANEAENVLKKYLTLDGIQNSPNGQPSFYEYRNTDATSAQYGSIDKPTFLWAGGLYIHALYQLAGLRINPSNIFFSPDLPDGFETVDYDLVLSGNLCRVSWKGNGKFFKNITLDGVRTHSAVYINAKKEITFERGKPDLPYLAESNCRIIRVDYNHGPGTMQIKLNGIPGMDVSLQIISPFEIQKFHFQEENKNGRIQFVQRDDIFTYTITNTILNHSEEVIVYFMRDAEH